MNSLVFITKQAQKDIKSAPKHIQVQVAYWIKQVELEGYYSIQKTKGYRDHLLRGNRQGQRSSYLSKSWRLIYTVDDKTKKIIVEILEVNKHDY